MDDGVCNPRYSYTIDQSQIKQESPPTISAGIHHLTLKLYSLLALLHLFNFKKSIYWHWHHVKSDGYRIKVWCLYYHRINSSSIGEVGNLEVCCHVSGAFEVVKSFSCLTIRLICVTLSKIGVW